jgi:molecular chaperone Hsp33
MGVPFEDNLTRFVFDRSAVRGAVVSLDTAYRDILACHTYPAAIQRVLGETLAAVCLLANSLKFAGSLVLQFHGAGTLRLLVVECSAALELRATAQWQGEVRDNAVLADLVHGASTSRMVLTLDPKDGGPLYQGVVALEGSSIAALFEHYLAKSEQLESRLWLRAARGRARGMLLQRMPGSTEADTDTWRRASKAIEARSRLFDAEDAHQALAALFPADDLRAFPPCKPRFACSCSRERVEAALRLLGHTEVDNILAERGMVGVDCEFCNRRYELEADEARALFAAPDPVAH